MINVKIIGANNFSFNARSIEYIAILKNKKEQIKGNIVVDFINEIIEVDFKRKLSYYEKIAVLKEIFYQFCLNNIKAFRRNIDIPIETFIFKDKNEESEEELAIINEILKYNFSEFNTNRKKEKIIANIKISYDLIKHGIEIGNKEIILNCLVRFNI